MRGKFVFGVELLTGLSIGAAAAAAAVALIISILIASDLNTETDHMATATAQALAAAITLDDASRTFESAASPLIQGGSVAAAALFDSSGTTLALVSSPGQDIESNPEDWYRSPIRGGSYSIGIMSSDPPLGAIRSFLQTGLAALTFCLALLAVITPRYLARTVLTPLRGILVEAERFSGGEGSTPEAAGASFHRLIELLHERDDQLDELRRIAETRADIVEKRSAAILSGLGSAVLALDGNGSVTLFNPLAGQLFSLNESDIGCPFVWELTDAGKALKPVLMNLGMTGGTDGEFQLTDSREGTQRMFGVSESRSPSGEIVILITDVTRIGDLERRIAEQDSMADIGAASAGISHEMGNTLCALSGFVDLLARGHSDERTLRILQEVREEVESAQALIHSFASLSTSPEPDESTLTDSEVQDLCREICAGKAGCEVTLKGSRFTVSADRKLLESCVSNLVRNAIEAQGTSKVDITIGSTAGNMRIEVSDDGPGLDMDPEEIFRPFRSTKDRNEGNMGLGLPVSRRIIRSMGGELRAAADNDGGGALFIITLPLLS